MSDVERLGHEGGDALLVLYDRSLPEVFGYLVRRCPTEALAEDLTAETFLAAVDAVRKGRGERLTTGWLITVARNKLVDHWRRAEREQRGLQLMVTPEPVPEADDWIEELDPGRALAVLDELGPHHRVALTLRYLDGLSVPQVADQLDRTVHATEALLVRARVAFRRAYEARSRRPDDDWRGSDDDD
jgi:RNA polymerase sigma-70 factor (ECF subfamily)